MHFMEDGGGFFDLGIFSQSSTQLRPSFNVWNRFWNVCIFDPNDKTPFWNRSGNRLNLFHICSKKQKKYLGTNLFPTAQVCSNGTYFILNNISPKPYNIKNTSLFHTLKLGLKFPDHANTESCFDQWIASIHLGKSSTK